MVGARLLTALALLYLLAALPAACGQQRRRRVLAAAADDADGAAAAPAPWAALEAAPAPAPGTWSGGGGIPLFPGQDVLRIAVPEDPGERAPSRGGWICLKPRAPAGPPQLRPALAMPLRCPG